MAVPAAQWEGRSAHEWQQHWRLASVHLYQSAGSTNDIALRLGEAGAAAPAIVIAEEQTRGRGRSGNTWHAHPEDSLILSLLFRISAGTGELLPGTVPVRVGFAVAESVAELSGAPVLLKWPNDVVIPGHGKIAGILCEAALGQQGTGYVVAGIGINVLQALEAWPAALRASAASILSATGVHVERAALITALIARLRDAQDKLTSRLSPAELERIRSRDVLFGADVVTDSGRQARARGIADDGALLLETAGKLERLYNGTVRLAHTGAYPGAQ